MDSDVYKTRQTLLKRLHDKYDNDSWKEFVDTYRNYIYVVIRRMGIDEADAEDIVQQVLMKLWEKLPEFCYDDKKRFRSFVAAITRNKVNDFIRSRKAESARLDKKLQESIEAGLNNINLPQVEVIAQREWELFITNMAMKNIRSSFKGNAVEVFEKMLAGMPVDEIAARLDIKINTVHQLNKRVRDRMIEEIQRLKLELE